MQNLTRWVFPDEITGCCQLNRRIFGQKAKHLLDPLDTFEPPVPKQLGIIVGGNQSVLARILVILFQPVGRQPGKMAGMLAHLIFCPVGMVNILVRKVHARPGHAPVLQSRHAILFVELPVVVIPRISPIPGPDLHAGTIVASDDSYPGVLLGLLSGSSIGNIIRFEG